MKKIIALLLACLALLFLVGCDEEEPIYVTELDGRQYITLPSSGEQIRVADAYVEHLEKLDVEMLKQAEEKLGEQLSAYEGEPSFYLSLDEDGKLCLCAEVIVKIDPPEVSTGGAVKDHKHEIFKENITR